MNSGKGWLRPWLIAIATVGLMSVSFVGYVVWVALIPHHHDLGDTTTAADVAQYTSVLTPPEAHNFRVAAFEFGQARSTFVRFKAPVEVCRAYAAKVCPNTELKALTPDQEYNDLMAIYMGSRELHDLRWFDLPYAAHSWNVQGADVTFQKPEIEKLPPAPNIVGADVNTEQRGYLSTSIRIDEANGVFYFFQVN